VRVGAVWVVDLGAQPKLGWGRAAAKNC
jgi:hypothetical protein